MISDLQREKTRKCTKQHVMHAESHSLLYYFKGLRLFGALRWIAEHPNDPKSSIFIDFPRGGYCSCLVDKVRRRINTDRTQQFKRTIHHGHDRDPQKGSGDTVYPSAVLHYALVG